MRNISIIFIYYSWGVIISKSQLYSENFINTCDVFFHVKISDDEKKLRNPKLKDTEIIIYKRKPIFESVLKNIVK
jgi:hypothetical protein